MMKLGSVQSFSPTLLVEVEYDQLKYRGCTHLSKLCVWGEKESSTHARSLASPRLGSPGRVWQNTRAHDIRVNGPPKSAPPLQGCCFILLFLFLSTWPLSIPRCGILIGFLIFRNRTRREVVGSSIYLTCRPQARSNRVRVLPLLAAAPHS